MSVLTDIFEVRLNSGYQTAADVGLAFERGELDYDTAMRLAGSLPLVGEGEYAHVRHRYLDALFGEMMRRIIIGGELSDTMTHGSVATSQGSIGTYYTYRVHAGGAKFSFQTLVSGTDDDMEWPKFTITIETSKTAGWSSGPENGKFGARRVEDAVHRALEHLYSNEREEFNRSTLQDRVDEVRAKRAPEDFEKLTIDQVRDPDFALHAVRATKSVPRGMDYEPMKRIGRALETLMNHGTLQRLGVSLDVRHDDQPGFYASTWLVDFNCGNQSVFPWGVRVVIDPDDWPDITIQELGSNKTPREMLKQSGRAVNVGAMLARMIERARERDGS